MKVMTIVGTRPEIIKLSRVIPTLDANFEHVLMHTGQNYDPRLRDVFFDEMKIRKPDLQASDAWGTPAEVIGQTLGYVDRHIEDRNPDAVLILGDTNSAVAAAYAAKRRHIPVFHLEAGNRCFDDRTPEEVNRRIVDTIADVNMPYTEHARRNLLAMGIAADRIVKTGSPMREVLTYYEKEIDACAGRESHSYFLISCHREENVENAWRLGRLVETANILTKYGHVIVSVHPRIAQRLKDCDFASFPKFLPSVELHEPFGFIEYARLQRDAHCVISDSGTLAEEAAILGFPAVSIRYATERPEGLEDSAFVLSDLGQGDVVAAVALAQAFGRIHRKVPVDYQVDNVSVKVAHTILSLTDYVRRTVWGK